MFHEGRRRLIDIGACNIPAWREAGLVKDYRLLGVSDEAILMTDHSEQMIRLLLLS
jgi:hypothetical protein